MSHHRSDAFGQKRQPSPVMGDPRMMNERMSLPCPGCGQYLDTQKCLVILHTERYQRWTGVRREGCQRSYTLEAVPS